MKIINFLTLLLQLTVGVFALLNIRNLILSGNFYNTSIITLGLYFLLAFSGLSLALRTIFNELKCKKGD